MRFTFYAIYSEQLLSLVEETPLKKNFHKTVGSIYYYLIALYYTSGIGSTNNA